MLITNAEIAGQAGFDVRIAGGTIQEIAAGLRPLRDEVSIDARGGALLPGLHDHHLHLFATASALDSVACGPPAVHDERALAEALRSARRHAPPGDTLRGVGYHESVAGDLDARRLDAWCGERPLRIQHRSGALWMLNTAALSCITAAPDSWPQGAERDADGRPTGRFSRLDDWLREQLGSQGRPSLAGLSRTLARHGITGVTDATPGLDDDDAAHLASAVDSGELLQRTLLMGSEALGPIVHARLERGALKIVLDEPRLPDIDALIARMRTGHEAGRPVAVHCATRVELAVAVTALREAGARAGDRIEHASVAPPEWVDAIADTPIAVVTQPHFIRERGDVYLRDVDAPDQPWLYRTRAWLDAGVPLAAGSDAPYGDIDPWASMRAAVERTTASGRVIGEHERLSPEQALALFTSEAAEPIGSVRKISRGGVADLTLLDVPWSTARGDLDTRHVALTLRDGEVIFARDEARPA